jgi:hypothetical protein
MICHIEWYQSRQNGQRSDSDWILDSNPGVRSGLDYYSHHGILATAISRRMSSAPGELTIPVVAGPLCRR